MVHFSNNDIRAIIVISCLTCFYIGVIIISDTLGGKDSFAVIQDDKNGNDKPNYKNGKRGRLDGTANISVDKLKIFDPNEADSATLASLGMSERQIISILHYRQAGGRFREANDIGKIYSITNRETELLMPYIRISYKYDRHSNTYKRGERQADNTQRLYYNTDNTKRRTASEYKQQYGNNKYTQHTLVDINTADQQTLMRIPGVGKAISADIIRLRENIGGFHNLKQVLLCDGVTDEIAAWIEVKDSTIRLKQININSASFRTLCRNPYIGYDRACDISNYRRLYGDFKNEESLIQSRIFTKESLMELRPYLVY